MNNDIKWKLSKIAPGKARIELEQFSKIPSIEEYESYIKNLLGLDKEKNNRNLIDDVYSVDLADSLLLYKELKELDGADYEEIIFSSSNGDITVNVENFEQVFENLKSNGKKRSTNSSTEAVKHAIGELFEH